MTKRLSKKELRFVLNSINNELSRIEAEPNFEGEEDEALELANSITLKLEGRRR